MVVETFREVRAVATVKWREYRDAEKRTKGKEPLYTDLKKMYWQIMHGKVLCDITEVIKAGGVHENFHPKLAVARADAKKVLCRYDRTGNCRFRTDASNRWRDQGFASDVNVFLPEIPREKLRTINPFSQQPVHDSRFDLEAPVPLIPPQHRPDKLTDEHYILWEVDEWRMVPPTDPYLLRRITKNIFAVEAQWDLTPLEKAAMAGRMH
jgi:hypothetical protein